MRCRIVGAPVQEGNSYPGCDMGPSSLRVAGIVSALRQLGHEVEDLGAVQPEAIHPRTHPNSSIKALPEISAWTASITEAAYKASADAMPIFLGGDHSMSAGSLAGVARRAADLKRPLFVLWLDAHPDFHTLDTTESGNLHGGPLAYALLYEGVLVFTKGVCEGDEPDLWSKAPDDRIRSWIEVGLPDPERLLKARRHADQVTLLAFGSKLPGWERQHLDKLINSSNITVIILEQEFINQLVSRLKRTVSWSITVTEGNLYLQDGAETLETSPKRYAQG